MQVSDIMSDANKAQIELWNGRVGEKWAALQASLGAMLAVAAQRTQGQARLLQTDASTWRSDALFDLAVSQLGLMFFANPEEAFVTIAANLRPGGRLCLTCWRAESENQWVTTPLAAIRPLLPEAPPPVPHTPGPFDFPVCLATDGGVVTLGGALWMVEALRRA